LQTNQFGFRCLVVGYEAMYQRDQGLKNLEMELSYLGGLCSASLMKRNLPLSSQEDATEEDLDVVEENAIDAFEMHSTLLSRGFALDQAPSVQMALDEIIPFSSHSTEMMFLRDFVNCSASTSGGRLARWLQPEAYVDVEKCRVIFADHSMKCNWPTIITVVTRDQYGDVVQVPSMRVCQNNILNRCIVLHVNKLQVEVKAVPIDEVNQGGSILRKATAPDAMTFGGHRPPNLDPKYEVTVKDKMFYHAITVHKNYDNYSFEELRFASPAVQRQSENMLVRANNDGTYSANWTPGNIGAYRVHVTIDGCDMTETFKVRSIIYLIIFIF
jgi:E3 ubiquitin-protein ligase MYCBP2